MEPQPLTTQKRPAANDSIGELQAVRNKVKGTNINEQTLLATDYLNHFNEIVMTLEMVPDMPDILDEAKEWQPKSYKDHFRDSTIADKDLAVEVYGHVPDKYRLPFEKTIAQIDRLIQSCIAKLEKDIARNDPELLRENARMMSRTIQKLMDAAGAIIHGNTATLDQEEIDALIED